VSSEECRLKTRPTHILKQDRPVCVTRRVYIKNQANSPTKTRQATVSVTRRVYIKNQANSLSVKEWPEHVSSEECIIKEMLTHHLKKHGPSMCFRNVQNKMQEIILSEIGKSRSSSPEQCTRKGKARE